MKILGMVTWKTTDKLGNPIAGVQPLFEVMKGGWRPIEAAEEFPTQGQIFWPLANDAQERAFVVVTPKENPGGQKDEYRVDHAEPVTEVIDFRTLGDPARVKEALVAGIKRADLIGKNALLWCSPNVLLGPVKLAGAQGLATLNSSRRDRIPTYSAAPESFKRVHDGRADRHVLVGDLPPIDGYVDWDDERSVVRRALSAAVDRARRDGEKVALTKRLIEEAADAITGTHPNRAELQLERYRLQQAKALCTDRALVDGLADDLAATLLTHPTVSSSLTHLQATLRADLERTLRSELDAELTQSREELGRVKQQVAEAQAGLADATHRLESMHTQIAETEAAIQRQVNEVQQELEQRLASVVQTPARLLSEVALLRPFLALAPAPVLSEQPASSQAPSLRWTSAAHVIDERVALQRALTGAFKQRGVAPGPALRLHAGIAAGLVPVVIGNASLSALAAYASVACGNRMSVLNVAPGFVGPLDLLGRFDGLGEHFRPHPGGLLAAAHAAAACPATLSIIACEGINRAPTESFLVPLLQSFDAGIPLQVPAALPDVDTLRLPIGLRVAATCVSGSTTLPVTPDLWAHAVAISVDATTPAIPSEASPSSDVLLDSDLVQPGAVPYDLVAELIEHWPRAHEVRAALERFGAALSQFESSDQIRMALVECILLPFVACLAAEEERTEALRAVQRIPGQTDAERLATMLHSQFRTRLG